jgi:hypothetical protein
MSILVFKNKWTDSLLVYPGPVTEAEKASVVNLYTKGGNWVLSKTIAL